MPDNLIHIEIEGLDRLQKAIAQVPKQAAQYLGAAGKEAAERVVLAEQGLKKYPPATEANAPPPPYYIRGRGTQTASGNRGNSERLGTRWYVKRLDMNTEIGNTASYARWVHGEEQAHFMAPKGWRKLTDVAQEKIPQITKVYQAWVDKLLRDCGL